MLRRLYDWTMGLARHRRATWALAGVSCIESSIFPIPPDVLLIPMVLARRERAFRIALVCTAASVVGGLVGYAIGMFLFEQIGRPILDFYGYAPRFAEFRQAYNDWGAWVVFMAGVTPFPYKAITILSGVTGLDVLVFTVASILSRGIRFYAVAWLLWRFGPPIKDFIERRLHLLFWLFTALLVGGFALAKFAF